MRGRMGGMKQFSVRHLLFLIAAVTPLFVVAGCNRKYRAAAETVEAMDKRMQQIKKEASSLQQVNRRDGEAKSRGE
jgi:outer membrane lipoprotein-sorting protein